jgi:signal transduction histidine kinase
LASILGNLEVFSIKDRTPKEYEQLSAKLIKQVLQLEEILDTLIIISDLRKNSDTVEQTRIDDPLWEIIEKISDRYPGSNILVHIEIEPSDEPLLFVSIDRTQLLMALFNLIENAVKFSRGQPIDIEIYKQDNKLFLTITDKGIGIMPEHLNNLNKPFYRADHTNRIEGSGIGLSIAFRILKKNGIDYRIESTVSVGTKVTLVI